MSRITNAILDQKAFGRGSTQPMLDVTYGGQHGYAPVLSQWVSNQAYVRNHLCAIVLEAPRFFQLMPDPQKWVETLKSMFELHARTIEGLNSGLTAEFADHPVGGAGEIQEEVTDMKRARSAPVTTHIEKVGRPFQTFIEHWMMYGMMSPDTKYALLGTLADNVPDDLLADWSTATVLFYEPDALHRKIVNSWITTNMMPKSTNDIIGKRDLTTAKEIVTLNIEWTAITQTGLGANIFAQKILDQIVLNNANPYLRPSFIEDISSDVKAATEGYMKNVKDLGDSAVSGVTNS